MSDEEQDAATRRLLQRFTEAKTREAALVSEAEGLAGKMGEVREALGNPYYYSGPRHAREENADKSIARFSGYASHEVGLRLIQDLQSTRDELRTLRKQLLDAGQTVD